jgi:GNAT superfamily N-acetyltransferase
MTLVVRRATAVEIFPLRHAVLRPGYPDEASRYADDEVAVHIGAWDGEQLVGCATVFAEPWPGGSGGLGPPAEPASWRLRGMAVAPERQGSGVGAQVLAAAVAAAEAAGAPMLWANARSTALGFYRRNGWQIAGEEFITADTGLPHVPITRAAKSAKP